MPVPALETKPATQSWTCMILLLEILYFHTSTAMELMLSESVHLRAKEGGFSVLEDMYKTSHYKVYKKSGLQSQ